MFTDDSPELVAARTALSARLDIAALLRVASSKRNGIPCSLSPDKKYGLVHAVYCVVFADGVKWAAKISLGLEEQLDLAHYSIEDDEAEVALLRFFEDALPHLPVPRIFAFDAEGADFGARYILMTWFDGAHVEWRKEDVPLEARRKIADQLASFLVDLFFGTTAPPHDTWVAPPASAAPTSATTLLIEHINYRIMRRCRGRGPGGLDLRDYLILRSLARTAVPAEFERGPFPIHHDDVHPWNVFWDEEYNLVGVIDWSGHRTGLRVSFPIFAFAAQPRFVESDRPYFLERLKFHEERRLLDHSPAAFSSRSLADLAAHATKELPILYAGWTNPNVFQKVLEDAGGRNSSHALQLANEELREVLGLFPHIADTHEVTEARRIIEEGLIDACLSAQANFREQRGDDRPYVDGWKS